MNLFFTQGIAVLFSQAPSMDAIRLCFEGQGYSTGVIDDTTQWPEMSGICLNIATDFDPAAQCWVDTFHETWPDDMGGSSAGVSVVAQAYEMGAYGPFVHPGAFSRALQAPGYKAMVQGAEKHQAYVRLRIIRMAAGPVDGVPKPQEGPLDASPAAEIAFLLRLASSLEAYSADAFYFNPNSEMIMPLKSLSEMLDTMDKQKSFPVMAVCRTAAYKVDEQWSLADSTGMQQLGIRDHEFAWADITVSRKEQFEFLTNLLVYQVNSVVWMGSGHTTEGPHGTLWRAEERSNSCGMPPRPVLHWTMENSPTEPEALAAMPLLEAATEADSAAQAATVEIVHKLDAWQGKREVIRTRAAQWLLSPSFRSTYYDDAHPPMAFKAVLQQEYPKKEADELWRDLECLGVQDPKLWNQYQELALRGKVLFATPIMVNPGFKTQPDTLFPCSVVVASTQTSEEMFAAGLFASMAFEIYAGIGDAEAHPGTASIVANDTYRLFGRETFPSKETQGLHFIMLCIQLRKSWMPPDDIPFVPVLAMPGPKSACIQIPWHIATGAPPPPNATAGKGRFSEIAELDRQADQIIARQESQGGCRKMVGNVSSLVVVCGLLMAIYGYLMPSATKNPEAVVAASQRRTVSTVKSWAQPASITSLVTVVKGEEYQPLIGDGLQGSGFLFKIKEGLILAGSSRHQFDSRSHIPGQMIDLDDLDVALDKQQLIRQPDSQIQLVTKLSKATTCLEYRPSDWLKNGDVLRLLLEKGEWIEGTLQTRRDVALTSPPAVLRMQVQTTKKVSGRSGSPVVHALTGRVVGVMLSADKAESPTFLEFETLNVVLIGAN